MSETIDAVLVSIHGLNRWCIREMNNWASNSYVYVGVHDSGAQIYAYQDVLSRQRFSPSKCKEIREAKIQVQVVEVEVK